MTAVSSTTEEIRAKLREWGPVVALALIPALPLLAGDGLVNTRAGGDSPFLLLRVHQLVQNLQAGVLPVRWMPQAAYGLGYPAPNFYAALPYYLAALLKLLGLSYISSIKIVQTLGFVFAAMAFYGFGRELDHGGTRSLLGALVYSCAPFHMINVYVRGDSLSEFYAFVFFPLVLWTLLRLHKRPRACAAAWVALAYAGLMLTHNISALIFTPIALAYALWLARGARHTWRSTAQSLAAIGMGALASAWFWWPALVERGNVHLEDMTTGYFNYALHFRGWDLVQPSLLFDYAISSQQQPFRMGLVQLLLLLGGLTAVLVRWHRARRVERQGGFVVVLLLISTFMITPLSRPLWDHVPLLPMVQFPWRFLSVQALAASLIVVYVVPRQPRWERAVALSLGALVVMVALIGLQPERLHIEEDDVTAQRLMLYEYFTANVGGTVRRDYLPRWVDPRPYTSEALWDGGTKPLPLTLEGALAAAALVTQGSTSERWTVEVASPEALLALHTYYYPGWEARVDGQPAEIEVLPGLGYIGLRLSEGIHDIQLRLERTRVQWLGEMISAVTFVGLLFLLVRRCRFDGTRLGAGVVMLGAVALLVLGMDALSALSPADKLDLTMDFDRVPYLHRNPDGVRFGGACRLTRYELSSETVEAGETVTVTTYWDDVKRSDLTVRVALVSPAQHLFAVSYRLAGDEQPVHSGSVQSAVQIPAHTMRGIYLLSVQVHAEEVEIGPITTRGETLATTYLMPIRVENWVPVGDDQPIIESFGERIALSKVQTVQPVAGTIEVTLTWQVFASPPQNYKTALRLKDRSGRDVARIDTQPGYGFYPTSMWRPGELVYDRYTLSVDDGTPPGTQYALQVVLYEAASLQPIGLASIPRVVISYPTTRQDVEVLHTFGSALILSQADALKTEVEQGDTLPIALRWAALDRMQRDYDLCVELLNSDGEVIAPQTMSLASEYPTSQWAQHAVVAGYRQWRVAPGTPPGQYSIVLIVLDVLTGEAAGAFTLPDTVRIVEARRNFVLPDMQTVVSADFGERVRLLGYDLQHGEQQVLLTLHWQAVSDMATDYKVFVHVFDPATEQIAAQQDVLAGRAGYPTTRWVLEEVVSQPVDVSLEGVTEGRYGLAVGLYHADERLPVAVPAGFTVSADRLLLIETLQVP